MPTAAGSAQEQLPRQHRVHEQSTAPAKPSCSAPSGVPQAHQNTTLPTGILLTPVSGAAGCCPQEQPMANPRSVPQPDSQPGGTGSSSKEAQTVPQGQVLPAARACMNLYKTQ